jgi:omega-amidase
MQDLTVALVQFNQFWEEKPKNHEHIETLLKRLERTVDLIVLPEMFDTGFSMNTQLADPWDKGPSLDFLKKLSRKHGAAVYTSMMARENQNCYNRGVFVTHDELCIYDKRKSFGLGGEDKFFKSGTTETIVAFKDWRINLQICYDLRFPELIRNRMIEDQAAYDLLLYVANWPEKRREHWISLLRARAIENQCYVIGVNRTGTDGKDLTYSGDSLFCDPLGTTILCEPNQENVLVVTLSKAELNRTREDLPFLKDR